jgi:hypothetical protein
MIAGEWIPLQASLIKSDAFFASGGFHPQLFATQDVDLSRRIALRWDFSKLDQTVAFIEMGVEGSQTNYAKAPAYSRLGRESVLNEPGVLKRMLASATDSYWKGRVVRAFATSAFWNLTHLRPLAALSRGLYSLVAFLRTLLSSFSVDYWKAIVRPYESPSFLEGFNAAELPVSRRELKDIPDSPSNPF